MEIVKLLLLTFLPAVVIGCLVGVLAGKHKIKKEAGRVRSILNTRQRIIYSVSILLGVACILVGIFYTPGGSGDGMSSDIYDPGMDMDPGMMEPGVMEPGVMEPAIDAALTVDGDIPQDEDAVLPEEPADYVEDENASADDTETAEAPQAEEPAAEATEPEPTTDAPAPSGGGTAVASAKPVQRKGPVSAPAVRVG